MVYTVCPVCLERQLSRPIDRDGAPWTEHYCPTHGVLWCEPRTEWVVAVPPEGGEDATERPA